MFSNTSLGLSIVYGTSQGTLPRGTHTYYPDRYGLGCAVPHYEYLPVPYSSLTVTPLQGLWGPPSPIDVLRQNMGLGDIVPGTVCGGDPGTPPIYPFPPILRMDTP